MVSIGVLIGVLSNLVVTRYIYMYIYIYMYTHVHISHLGMYPPNLEEIAKSSHVTESCRNALHSYLKQGIIYFCMNLY